LSDLAEKVVIQLSGSNCALAVPELLRILVDVERMPWEKAWHIASHVFAYTSNAVSREHLESWPVYLMTQIFPRHMQIIYEINQTHLDDVRKNQGAGEELVRDLSLIAEGEVRRVKLGHLATVGSSVVNGVSAAQTEILTKSVFPEFMTVSPQKFQTKTNGVSHRRWLLCANRPLGNLITEAIGEGWIKQPDKLSALESFATDSSFLERMQKVRSSAKKALSAYVKESTGISVNADAMFDVQCKKIHQYKRQVLHVLFVIARYLQIKQGAMPGIQRMHIFAGKAAPSDQLARQIIRLITFAGEIVNNDPDVKDALKVVLLPDYGVTLAEKIIPASDLSEQIATPGQEASGTGNAKFAINGGLLMASKSGTNLEIVERVGINNVFLFGRSSQELPSPNSYQAYDVLSANAMLSEIFKFLNNKLDSMSHDAICIRPLLSTLMDSDRYFVLLDFDDYLRRQADADALFANPTLWAAKGVVNIARSGYFSIDRTIRQYASDIWKASL
jgi:starch phosphorylase